MHVSTSSMIARRPHRGNLAGPGEIKGHRAEIAKAQETDA